MTKEAALKYRPEIVALQDGKTIQQRTTNMNGEWSEWMDVSDPYFVINPTIEFRVKPEAREFWRILRKGALASDTAWSNHATLDRAKNELLRNVDAPDLWEIVHFKEVL